MNILVTGGTGYIGSHISHQLLCDGYKVTIIDNLSNSNISTIDKLNKINSNKAQFFEGDICDQNFIKTLFKNNKIDLVIHLAGLKSISESIQNPIKYYSNNVTGSINLFNTMRENNVYKIIFSSSATVYGDPQSLPITEEHDLCPINPYGKSKKSVEDILMDLANYDNKWRIVSLRYFNPLGANDNNFSGDYLEQDQQNIMPTLIKAAKKDKKFNVFGNDYPTKDGTAIRDYIHIQDLVDGHISTISYLKKMKGYSVFNLGTSTGYSVLEVIDVFKKVSKLNLSYNITNRREGDSAACYASNNKAREKLNWKPKKNLIDMIESAWKYSNTVN
jgi:UDP-glucose 4-epimerase